MKLLYITVTMPFGECEPFFIPEVQEMVRQGCQLLIVPRSPSAEVNNRDAEGLVELALSRPLLCGEILAVALGEFLRRPIRSLTALGWLFRSRNLTTWLKNLAGVPQEPVDRPAGTAMGRRPHPCSMGDRDQHDGHGGQPRERDSVELHRPPRRYCRQ